MGRGRTERGYLTGSTILVHRNWGVIKYVNQPGEVCHSLQLQQREGEDRGGQGRTEGGQKEDRRRTEGGQREDRGRTEGRQMGTQGDRGGQRRDRRQRAMGDEAGNGKGMKRQVQVS
jgi:hypothetical protein